MVEVTKVQHLFTPMAGAYTEDPQLDSIAAGRLIKSPRAGIPHDQIAVMLDELKHPPDPQSSSESEDSPVARAEGHTHHTRSRHSRTITALRSPSTPFADYYATELERMPINSPSPSAWPDIELKMPRRRASA